MFFKISFTVSKGCTMQLSISNTALLTLILLTIYYYNLPWKITKCTIHSYEYIIRY